ncbi:MAG TPA: ATP-binding cassette domain-containing protein [Candidatus Limnocylindria bacterium]|nr:ATP-binding cassette domain-containing protein [Candidatus Limnocylindria bacterium]
MRPLTSSTPDALWASRSVRTLKPAAVVCEGVTRRLRGQQLLDDLTMVVGVGARLLVVSRPEQSASMLLRVLAGLSRMRSGTVRLAGVARPDSSPAGWARRVGYVGPEAGIYPWMTPREVLDLAGRIAEYDPSEIRRRIDRIAELHRFGASLDQPIRRGGEPLAQRVALASAMLTDPEVLLLDEPLRAVEAEERARLLTIPGRRRTVVIASRYPASEVGLVNQVAFLGDGRLALHAPVEELERRGLALSQRGIDALIELYAAEAG